MSALAHGRLDLMAGPRLGGVGGILKDVVKDGTDSPRGGGARQTNFKPGGGAS